MKIQGLDLTLSCLWIGAVSETGGKLASPTKPATRAGKMAPGPDSQSLSSWKRSASRVSSHCCRTAPSSRSRSSSRERSRESASGSHSLRPPSSAQSQKMSQKGPTQSSNWTKNGAVLEVSSSRQSAPKTELSRVAWAGYSAYKSRLMDAM